MEAQQESQHPVEPGLLPDPVLDRRAHPRHLVDSPARIDVLLVEGQIQGRILDLSLGGCLIHSEKRAGVSVQARVEVSFCLRGMAFRLAGVVVSCRSPNAFAVRFAPVPALRLEELSTALAEVQAANAARERAQAVSAAKPHSSGPQLLPQAAPAKAERNRSAARDAKTPAARAASPGFERRASSRHAVDTRAKLLLVKTAIPMQGRIVNLSLGGCQIRMEERFNVGIYVRVEAEFYLHGLPFRVGGVSQAIVDKFTIGVRFLDMSPRRREQLSELIAEIDELRRQPLPAAENVTVEEAQAAE